MERKGKFSGNFDSKEKNSHYAFCIYPSRVVRCVRKYFRGGVDSDNIERRMNPQPAFIRESSDSIQIELECNR